uniref:C2H2-type domain-containing protein n=2 Tax=Lutzomyia longipalpis TaxID=7200 RepID=A0A1B0CS34_LUTLO
MAGNHRVFTEYTIPQIPFCRLCLHKLGLLRKVTPEDEISYLMDKHLGLSIHEASYLVCEECCRQLTSFGYFYTKVQETIDSFLADVQQNARVIYETSSENLKSENDLEDFISISQIKLEHDNDNDEEEEPLREPEEPEELLHPQDVGRKEDVVRRKSTRLRRTNRRYIPDQTTSQRLVGTKRKSKDTLENHPKKPRNSSQNTSKQFSIQNSYAWPSNLNRKDFPEKIFENYRNLFNRTDTRELISKFYDLQCKICKRHYRNVTSFQKHNSTVHKKTKPLFCSCSMEVKNSREAYVHMVQHIQPDALRCDTCGLLESNMYRLKTHKTIHLPKIYKCDKCPSAFETKKKLQTHKTQLCKNLKQKTKIRFSCHYCGKCFSTKNTVYQHMISIHFKKLNYKCTECGKQFLNRAKLKWHQKKEGHDLLHCT